MPTFGYEDVGGFDVPVDNVFPVSGIEALRNLDGQIENCFYFQRAASDAVFQRLPVQKFHRNKVLTVLFADVINGANIRVI